jgi:hypothetical protein
MAEVVRRRRTPRLDAVTALALVIPLVTVGVLLLVRQAPARDERQPPTLTRLTNATVVCPAAAPGSADGFVSTASGASGKVSVGSGAQASDVPVRTGAVTRISGRGAVVVKGEDALAPGLLALRSGTAPLTVQQCSVPASEQWFTGVGAGATHDSVIELVNPDAGPADADITLYGSQPFTARKLHGITIPAHKTVSLDLGAIVPRRFLLSAQVQVTRGRLGVHVLDRRTDLVTHKVRREWLPRQDEPALDNRLLGLPAGTGSRTLQIANPGDSDARAQVRIVTGDTSFAPAGLDTVRVPAGATTSVSLTRVLARAAGPHAGRGEGAVGVEVTSDEPVTASLLSQVGADEAFTVSDPVIRDEAATLLPAAPATSGSAAARVGATLYVSADSAGAVAVTAYDASGRQLLGKRYGEQQGHTVAVPLPKGTAFLRVVPQRTEVRAAVVLSGDGASVVPLHELLTRGLVPQIRPGLS